MWLVKTSPSISSMIKVVKIFGRYLLHDKNAILNFFLDMNYLLNCSTHQISYLSDHPFTFFANKWNQIFILRFGKFCIIERKNNSFLIKKWTWNKILLYRISKMSVSMENPIVNCLVNVLFAAIEISLSTHSTCFQDWYVSFRVSTLILLLDSLNAFQRNETKEP